MEVCSIKFGNTGVIMKKKPAVNQIPPLKDDMESIQAPVRRAGTLTPLFVSSLIFFSSVFCSPEVQSPTHHIVHIQKRVGETPRQAKGAFYLNTGGWSNPHGDRVV
jgi:hypothetical protein